MDSTGVSSPAYDSFKSKKVLRSSASKPHSSGEAVTAPEQSPWSSKTPEKPTHQRRRPLTRRQPLRSVKQVREAAKKLQKSDLKPSVSSDPVTSSAPPIETPIAKPNTSKSLPEKYEILDKFFNSLESSIRLLGLKGSMSTFTNISRTVESLTDRRFAYTHLAQLKFLLPEAIEIKKILVRDDRTSCMKPDLHVTLNFSIIQHDEKLKSDSGNLQMRKLFRSRLVSFCNSNPEGDEVPEEMLPEPFNQSGLVASLIAMEKPNTSSVQDTRNTIAELQPAVPVVASHMSQSFRRSFSKRALSHSVETMEQKTLTPDIQVIPASKQVSDHCVPNAASPVKLSAKLPKTPIKNFDLEKKEDLSSMGATSIDGTPAKLISTPYSATPAQTSRPPVRCSMSPDEDSIMSPTKLAPRKLTRRSSGRRSITFDNPVKTRKPCLERGSSDDDLSDILPVDLLDSIKEKERKAIEDNDPAISQAKWRKQMIAGLPRLFDILLFFFQSIKRSVITKEELVHRIISSHLEIVDRREVDEQLRLLQELAPEWIYEKMSSTGDLLFCVNKISSPESIRTRLSEAN